MSHPNSTVIVPTEFTSFGITEQTRKFVMHGTTSNDIQLSLDVNQKRLLSRVNLNDYETSVYPKPNTIVDSGEYGINTDIAFYKITSPNFPIIVEKIKVCLHQSTTYGCLKINLFDYGNSEDNIPENLIGIVSSAPEEYTSPLTIPSGYSLISNVLEPEDSFMQSTQQSANLSTFEYTIQPNSLLRFGIQYAESNAYGLKIFIIGWTIQCD